MTRQFIDLSKIPKAEARVLIAQDVLNQLNLKKIIATKGKYFEFKGGVFDDNDFLHEVIARSSCEVCALGSLYYSRVQLANETKCDVVRSSAYGRDINLINNSGTMSEDLLQYFNIAELDSIESFFEGWSEALEFAYNNPDPEIRMRKIMQNIIDNNGDFKPELL